MQIIEGKGSQSSIDSQEIEIKDKSLKKKEPSVLVNINRFDF